MSPIRTRPARDEDLLVLSRTLRYNRDLLRLRQLLPSLTVLSASDEEVLVREGEMGAEVFVVLHGIVAVRRLRWLFFHKKLALLKPGDFFGEIAFLVPTPRSASVIAEGPCEVLRIASRELKGLLEHYPDLRVRFEEIARKRIYALSGGS